jgi:RimJ/RimL family protein N-acetyltransferase
MRPASEADSAAIVRMHELPHVSALLNTPTPDDVKRRLERSSSFDFIAVDASGEPAGLLMVDRIDSWLYDVGRILAAREREGIGSSMMRWALQFAFETNGAHRVFLEVHESNVRARRLYESFGFTQEGTYRDGFRSPLDGHFENLCPYGLLESDYFAAKSPVNAPE